MAKVLKPYTIIPANLYVSRDADRQIEDIIEDMGRPGYVLVSRQMGKTNLLLNAKRKLESSNDLFIYIDLSNPFDTSKSCFENIINSALEINEDKFQGVYEEVIKRREELIDTPPHKQHTNELRLLLKHISGKLVIILDEIDALTKTPYSDQIFAQIRSVYFSRVNFPELERLTYILSGVVEPTEIIKDPKISPFNIGQKIFLNDFSKFEFFNFLQLSGLILSDELKDRIFFWTHGSPRITWDLCSEIENKLSTDGIITVRDIDKIITDQYLTSFDRPPIDNIRELVKQDREIRNAILQIIDKKTNNISDKIKNKLYLAGITNYNETNIEIKNEVIEQSLRIEWISSLEEEEKGLIKLAVESYSSQDFSATLRLFERYLAENEFDDSINRPHYYYMMGFSFYKTLDFEKAIASLNLTSFDLNDEPKAYYDTILLKAICYTYLEQYDEAHFNYKLVIDSGRKDETYIKSLINYGSVSVKAGKENLLDNALQIFVAIIDDLDVGNVKIKESQIIEIKSIAYYNSAVIYSTKGELEVAEKYLKKALESASPESKPFMSLSLLDILNKPDEKFNLLKDIVKIINNNEIDITEFDPDVPLKFSTNELREVAIQCFLNFRDSLFLDLSAKIKEHFNSNLGAIVFNIAVEELDKQNWELAHEIFSNLSDEADNKDYNLTKNEIYDSLKFSCYLDKTNATLKQYLSFAEVFAKSENESPDVIEIENIASLIIQLTAHKRLEEALNYVSMILKHKDKNDALLINYLVIDHLELNVYQAMSDKRSVLRKAQELVRLSNDPKLKNQKSNFLGETGLDLIKKNAENIIKTNTPRMPIKNHQKYGRNDIVKARYTDGIVVETKFKKIEIDMNNGLCIILE